MILANTKLNLKLNLLKQIIDIFYIAKKVKWYLNYC